MQIETFESLGMNIPVIGHSDLIPNRGKDDPKFVNHKIPDKKGRRIFDVTLYGGEAAQLYIRLWRYYDYVDKFIIANLKVTYTNIPVNRSYYPFEEELKQFWDKVYMIREIPKVDYSIDRGHDSWSFENSVRRYLTEVLKDVCKPKPGDLILFSDLDEQVTREGLEFLINDWPKQQIRLRTYHQQPNFLFSQGETAGLTVVPYTEDMPDLLTLRRKSVRMTPTSFPYSTHCSWCFTHLENYTFKKDSYSHQEKNVWPQNDDSYTFRYHWCRFWDTIEVQKKPDITPTGSTYENLMPNHPLLKYLITPGYILDITKTVYEYDDLETMCKKPFMKREEWEMKAKAKGIYIIRTPRPIHHKFEVSGDKK